MYEDLKGKKLLIIGADMNDIAIVKAAQSLGVYTISVDWNTDHKKSPAKLVSDEAWDMNYRDVKSLAERCAAEKVDGVMAGYSETRVLLAAKLCKLLNKPFFATEKIVEMTRDKRQFKELCIRNGVPVPKEYCTGDAISDEEIAEISYPVIVKPADYGGRIGISICRSSEELSEGIRKALSVSESKRIVVEEYVYGVEMCAIYNLSDGEIELALLNDKYKLIKDGRETVLCNATIVPSNYMDVYMDEVHGPIKALLKDIGAKDGVAFFQMIAGKNGIRVFEMGYRLNGGNDYHIIEEFNHISYMNMLISHSLTGSMGDNIKKNDPCFPKETGTILFYVHGGTVGEINYEGFKDIPGIIAITQKVFPGTAVEEDGTTRQEALVVRMYGDTINDIADSIHKMQECISIKDINGKDMLFEPFDTDRLTAATGQDK